MKLLRKLFVLFFIALSGCIHAPVTQQISEIPQKVTTFKNTVVSLTFDDGAADNYDVRPILPKMIYMPLFMLLAVLQEWMAI